MSTTHLLAGLGGGAATIGGVFLLRRAWKAADRRKLPLIGGWGLLLAATPVWAVFGGPDRGVAFGIIAILLCALAALGATMLTAPERNKARPSPAQRANRSAPSDPALSWPQGLRKAGVFLLAGPVAGLSALALTTALFTLSNMNGAEITGNATAAFFIFPLAWAALSAIAVIDPKLWRKSLGIIGAGAAGAAFLAFAA